MAGKQYRVVHTDASSVLLRTRVGQAVVDVLSAPVSNSELVAGVGFEGNGSRLQLVVSQPKLTHSVRI